MTTIFDKILRKEIPAKVVLENEDVLAFHDVNPHAKVHVLVIPKHKMARFSDMVSVDEKIVGRFFKNVAVVASHLQLDEKGYRIVVNCGEHGCQSVEYLHAHILGGEQLPGWDG